MAQAQALQMKDATGIGDGVAAAWRRMWRKRDADSTGGTDGSVWTTGVTYRGYLGAHNGVSTSWMSEQQMKETQALLRMAAAAGRLGAWSVDLAAHKWVWSDEVKTIHDVPPDYEPGSHDALSYYTPESQERMMEAFDACARRGVPFDLELQLENKIAVVLVGTQKRVARHWDARAHKLAIFDCVVGFAAALLPPSE